MCERKKRREIEGVTVRGEKEKGMQGICGKEVEEAQLILLV